MNFKRKLFAFLCFLGLNGIMVMLKHVDLFEVLTVEKTKRAQEDPFIKERSIMKMEIKDTGPSSRNSSYQIVLYHFYHTMLKWKGSDVDMSKCSVYKNCEVRHRNKCTNEPIEGDAIVFQGNNMPRDIPKRANSEQVFVYLNIESPQYLQRVKLSSEHLQEFFNWTMTYRYDSDIPYLYGTVVPRSMPKHDLQRMSETTGNVYNYRDFINITRQWPNKYTGIKDKDYDAIFDQKTKSSVWFVSHCNTASKREKYIFDMQRSTRVDIFGTCSLDPNICPKNSKNCSGDIEKIYKFILAFENSLCEDYVTEKVFNRFEKNIIVVAFGAHNYSKYLPKDTYIDANDFSTPGDLAEYLNYVGSNKTVYLDYLKRKDQYYTISEKEHVQQAYCTLCYRLNHLDKYRKQAAPLGQWWHGPGVCNNPTIIDSRLGKRKIVPRVQVPS